MTDYENYSLDKIEGMLRVVADDSVAALNIRRELLFRLKSFKRQTTHINDLLKLIRVQDSTDEIK